MESNIVIKGKEGFGLLPKTAQTTQPAWRARPLITPYTS